MTRNLKAPRPAHALKMQKRWEDPEYRARMKTAQKAIGYRTYPI